MGFLILCLPVGISIWGATDVCFFLWLPITTGWLCPHTKGHSSCQAGLPVRMLRTALLSPFCLGLDSTLLFVAQRYYTIPCSYPILCLLNKLSSNLLVWGNHLFSAETILNQVETFLRIQEHHHHRRSGAERSLSYPVQPLTSSLPSLQLTFPLSLFYAAISLITTFFDFCVLLLTGWH